MATPADDLELGATSATYTIQGRTLELPVEIAEANAGAAVFSADTDGVAGELPEGIEPLQWRPGRTLLVIGFVEYRDNPLGEYDEVIVASAARVPGSTTVGGFVHHMPVTEEFTCEAGATIWGYPKQVDELELRETDRRAGARWWRDDSEVLTLSVPRGSWAPIPKLPASTFTLKDGQLHRTVFRVRGSGARVSRGRVAFALGSHPVSAWLRELNLSPVATGWVEGASLEFGPAEPL